VVLVVLVVELEHLERSTTSNSDGHLRSSVLGMGVLCAGRDEIWVGAWRMMSLGMARG
jgi:hypothetical protein